MVIILWLMMVDDDLVGGWPTPLKNDGLKVSWDDDIPNIDGKNHPNVPNHQAVILKIVQNSQTLFFGSSLLGLPRSSS